MINTKQKQFYYKKNIVIAGGLGFIGSTLARGLVGLGAKVTVVDNLMPDSGANIYNVKGLEEKISIIKGDVRDMSLMNIIVKDVDIIFNLAGSLSHVDSMNDPLSDMDNNCKSQLTILESCRKFNPNTRIIHTGTRNQYGRAMYLPVDENHPTIPVDINGIHSIASEWYYIMYYKAYGIKTCSIRLTNTFGPRHQMKHCRQGVLNWFIRQIMDNQVIKLYGGGSQTRDCIYVDDVVSALIEIGMSNNVWGESFNLGAYPISLKDFVKLLIKVKGNGKYEECDFPNNLKTIEIGDFIADCTKINKAIGWKPRVDLITGIKYSFDFYEKNREHYWS